MLVAENIKKWYDSLAVLKGVSLELNPGEVVALIGSSGAGKSTLLQVLGTLDRADGGSIHFNGENVRRMNERQQATFRNKNLGFVFQFHHLLPEFSAWENVAIPGMISGKNQQQTMDEAKKLLVSLGLEDRLHHRPAEMSGGEQQRVAMARAMINKPQLILADEPTGNLDTKNTESMYSLIRQLATDTGVGFLIATHNMDMAGKADRVLHIQDGILQD